MKKKVIRKVLIANRGEIAVRIIRACHDLGLETVAIYSQADAEALHVLHADEAICIGEAPSSKSYLKIPAILSACEITGADAIHPGYGFLSENASFASICESCGLTFIGPTSQAIALLGDKSKAKKTAHDAGCPIIPGSKGVVKDLDEAKQAAKAIGFPIFIKAVAGGGGKGIRIAYSEEEFLSLLPAARAEAEVSFGNSDVYLEKMIIGPRHVEVQVLGDQYGHIIHLGERDCTIQRRRQKLIEETPSPVITPKMREKIGNAAIAVVKKAGYSSADSVEFLLDRDGHFYFMEVNTRIQVEHTITEELTGIDLVCEQIRIAQGFPLEIKQKDVRFEGHVFQFRINAEDPDEGFRPCAGKLEYYLPPGGRGVRIDSSAYPSYSIPPHYDSMIAKLIVKGKNREEAIQIAIRALREFHIGGIHSTIPFHLFMLRYPPFLTLNYNLTTVDKMMEEGIRFSLS